MIYLNSRKGITLVEIITVVVILGTLATALYMGTQPYIKRSRDTRRITDLTSYMNILDAYDKNFDTYPSNYGSGGSLNRGYCLSEIYTRPDYAGYQDMKFKALSVDSSIPPVDPGGLPGISPCTMTGSYFYSRLDFGTDSQMPILAANLEMRESANYGTGVDLVLPTSVNSIKAAKKGTVSSGSPDGIFLIFKIK